VHETTDPGVVVAEYDHRVTGPAGVFTAANVQILTVTDGLISRSRDFHHHATLAAALIAA
jgi:ketosteroid isomerase-like protein